MYRSTIKTIVRCRRLLLRQIRPSTRPGTFIKHVPSKHAVGHTKTPRVQYFTGMQWTIQLNPKENDLNAVLKKTEVDEIRAIQIEFNYFNK